MAAKTRPATGNKADASDPLQVNARLYRQIARLLDQLEEADKDITMPQRINALIAVGRIQIMFATLRKREQDDPRTAGSTVRRYSAAFQSTNAARGGALDSGFADESDNIGLDGDGGDATPQ